MSKTPRTLPSKSPLFNPTRRRLLAFAREAKALCGDEDYKLIQLLPRLQSLLKDGFTHPPQFDRARVNFNAAGDYILPFVGSLLRHLGGDCEAMTLIRAYAMLLGNRSILYTLAEAHFGAEAAAWVQRFNQTVDSSWFLPILRGLDNRDVIRLEECGNSDVFVRFDTRAGAGYDKSMS